MKQLIALLFCFTLAAQTTVNNFTVKTNLSVAGANVPLTVNSISELVSLNPVYNTLVEVAGYYSSNDGGGGKFKRVLASSGSTNTGTFFKSTVDPSFAWKRIATGDRVNVKWFGALGNGSSDDTSKIQDAINYSQSLTDKPTVLLPEGRYVVSSIASTNVSLISDGGKMSNGGDRIVNSAAATLIHKVGATNDLLTLRPFGNPVPSVRNISFVGNREQNRKTVCTITGVTDRTHFVVSTNNLPAAPASSGSWPYYGYCFFFSNEGRYVGSGLVTSINYTTGAIVLANESDQYATLSSASNLLSVGFAVSFSSSVTETGYTTTTGVDSTTAGYSAINLTAANANMISEVLFEDLKIERFHTGIRLGNNLFTYISRVFINACSFAGIASAFPGESRDGIQSGLFLQGFYGADWSWPSAETNTYSNIAYRSTLYGYYGVESSGAIDDIRIDHTVHGLFVQNTLESQVNQILIDNPVSHGIVFAGVYDSNSRINLDASQIIVRNVNSASFTANTTNSYYAIKVFGDYNQISIGDLSVVKFGTNKFFNAIFDGSGSNNRLRVNNLFTAQGATNSTLYSGSSTVYPVVANFAEVSNVEQLDIAGSTKQKITSTSHSIYNPLSVYSTIAAGTNKTVLYPTGGTGFDSKSWAFTHGSDEDNGDLRTNLKTKRSSWFVPNYTNSALPFGSMTLYSSSTGNSVNLGGGDPSAEAATTLNVYLAGTKGETSGTLMGTWNTSQLDITSGRLKVSDGPIQIKTVTISVGTGSPEGALGAAIGSIYLRTDGGAGTTLYVKESGTGTTGWIGK